MGNSKFVTSQFAALLLHELLALLCFKQDNYSAGGKFCFSSIFALQFQGFFKFFLIQDRCWLNIHNIIITPSGWEALQKLYGMQVTWWKPFGEQGIEGIKTYLKIVSEVEKNAILTYQIPSVPDYEWLVGFLVTNTIAILLTAERGIKNCC